MRKQKIPPRNIFDDTLAKELVGRSLLVGITHTDAEGKMLSRSQIFGLVTIANRLQGICIRNNQTSEEKWFPPDTRGINLPQLVSTAIVRRARSFLTRTTLVPGPSLLRRKSNAESGFETQVRVSENPVFRELATLFSGVVRFSPCDS
jgi:hypothetical protein